MLGLVWKIIRPFLFLFHCALFLLIPLFFLGFLLNLFFLCSADLILPLAFRSKARVVIPLDVKLGNAGLIKQYGSFCRSNHLRSRHQGESFEGLLTDILVVNIIPDPNKLLISITHSEDHGSHTLNKNKRYLAAPGGGLSCGLEAGNWARTSWFAPRRLEGSRTIPMFGRNPHSMQTRSKWSSTQSGGSAEPCLKR